MIDEENFEERADDIPKGPMYVYSKQVKYRKVESNTLTRKVDKEQVSAVIASLREIGKRGNLEDFELRENCREWVSDILSGFSESKEVTLKYLLNDFTDSMMTRMREEDKFALAVVFDGSLLLCHSSIGEQTITPLWKVVDRMLDKDTVERFVLFHKENLETMVTYYEKFPSEFFTRWLGIPEREAFFYLGGMNRIYVDIGGVHCALELNDDDVEERLLKDTSLFKVEENQLILSTHIERLTVNQIRVGKKRYDSMGDFLQDYLAKRYDISSYREEYRKLAESLDVFEQKYIDDFDGVISVSSSGGHVKVRKRNPNFQILFAGKLTSGAIIDMRESFFKSIFTNFLNGTHIRIFHARYPFRYPLSQGPFKIGSLEIFNEIESNMLITNLINFSQKTNIVDDTLKNALYYSIFLLLSDVNEDGPISYFFTKFVNELGRGIRKSGVVLQNETDVMEFKSRDYLVGKDDEDVSKRVSKDVKTKIASHPFKIYLFGIEDETKKVEPLASSKFSSDRVNSLEKKIAKDLSDEARIALVKVPLGEGDECLLIMFVIKGGQ